MTTTYPLDNPEPTNPPVMTPEIPRRFRTRIDFAGETFFTPVKEQYRSVAIEEAESMLRFEHVCYTSIEIDDGRQLVIPGAALGDVLFFVEEI